MNLPPRTTALNSRIMMQSGGKRNDDASYGYQTTARGLRRKEQNGIWFLMPTTYCNAQRASTPFRERLSRINKNTNYAHVVHYIISVLIQPARRPGTGGTTTPPFHFPIWPVCVRYDSLKGFHGLFHGQLSSRKVPPFPSIRFPSS